MSETAVERQAAQEGEPDDTEPLEGTQERPGGDPEESLSAEKARKLQSEARNLRKRAQEAEAKLAEKEKTELTDRERLERDLSDRDKKLSSVESELRTLRVQMAANKLGFTDPEVASALIDWDNVEDDPKSLERELRELLKRKPHLASDRSIDANAGRGQRPNSNDMNALIRRGRAF